MEKYVDYLRCGEIYKSPSHSNKTPYILKCFQCEDIFLLLESFIFHIEDYCQPKTKELECVEESAKPNLKSDEEMPANELDVNDDLIVVKNEPILDIDYEENLSVTPRVNSDSDVEIVETNSETDEPEEGLEDGIYEIIVEDSESDEDEQTCGDKSLSSFVSGFMESSTNVMKLISAYKKQPQLWNKRSHVDLNEDEQHGLEKITEEVNSELHLNTTCQQVSAIISHFHREYKEDLKCIEDNIRANNYKPSWYFVHLHFLKPFVECNNIKKLYKKQPNLLQEQILQILEIYKEFPHLWKTDLAEYCCNNKRHDALHKMRQIMKTKIDLNVTQTSLKRFLRNIHNYFGKEKRRLLNNSDAEDIPLYYNQMLFLSDHVGPFKCLDCDIELKTPFMLKIHNFGIHGGSLPFTCSVCSKQFRSSNSYVSHAKRHMGDLFVECKQCYKTLPNDSELKVHMLSHSQKIPFRYHCPTCSKGFNVNLDFKNHLKTHRTRNVACKICGKIFMSKAILNNHIAIHTNRTCARYIKLKQVTTHTNSLN